MNLDVREESAIAALYADRLSYRRIAELLGLPASAVRRHTATLPEPHSSVPDTVVGWCPWCGGRLYQRSDGKNSASVAVTIAVPGGRIILKLALAPLPIPTPAPGVGNLLAPMGTRPANIAPMPAMWRIGADHDKRPAQGRDNCPCHARPCQQALPGRDYHPSRL